MDYLYLTFCVFNAYLSYTATMLNTSNLRDQKDFVFAKKFQNIASESGCF